MTPFFSGKNIFMMLALANQVVATTTAMAQTKVAELKDWSLWESSANGVETCTLQSIDKVLFRSEDFIMELSKAKNNAALPVEITMRIQKNKKESTALSAQIGSSNRFLSFSDLTGTKDIYWGVPKNLSALMTQLKENSEELAVKAKGGKKEIDFTIRGRGFSEMVTEMEKRCNGSQPLVRESFEDEFLNAVSDTVNPVELTPNKITQLRTSYFAAYQIHTLLLETKSQLNQVLAKYQTLVDELNSNRNEFNQITKSDLPISQKTLADAQKLQIDMKAEIARLAQLIPSLSAKVQASQMAYDKSRAILAPLEPEFNRLTSGLKNAQQLLATAESNLDWLNRRLQDISVQITSLQNESNRIQNILPGLKFDLDRATTQLRQAEAARSQFNMSWERDRALRANPDYANLKNELQILDSRLATEHVRQDQLQSERNRIAKDLEVCRATAGADCAQLEQGVANADQLLAQQRSTIDQTNGRRNEVSARIRRIENQIENELQHISNQLNNNEQNARDLYRRIEQDVSQNEGRLSSIRNIELPTLINETNQRNSERATAQSQISQGQQGIDQFSRDLTKFKSANDWDKKSLDVDTKSNQLASDQKQLSEAQNLKALSEKKLAQAINTESDMKKRISDLNARVLVLNNRASELNLGLKNLPAERAPFDAQIASLQNDLDIKKQDFLNLF